MILIFDTCGGLCNQIYDINSSINFCLTYNINFSYRYCKFRKNNNNLNNFYNEPFEKLFDLTYIFENFSNIKKLYIQFSEIQQEINNMNIFDNNKRCNEFLDKNNNIYNQLKNLNKKYVILKQFWSVCNIQKNINIYPYIKTNKKLYDIYIKIKKQLPDKYNCIHYRYEKDFVNHFKCDIINLKELLNRNFFSDNTLNTYISVSNIYECLNENDFKKYPNILYKNNLTDINNLNLNFEEKAFIDFLICKNSFEFIGNKLSSFSHVINKIKNTNNYYN